jgi:hypothetical protein
MTCIREFAVRVLSNLQSLWAAFLSAALPNNSGLWRHGLREYLQC